MALSTPSTRTPVAIGSRVPACPTLRVPPGAAPARRRRGTSSPPACPPRAAPAAGAHGVLGVLPRHVPHHVPTRRATMPVLTDPADRGISRHPGAVSTPTRTDVLVVGAGPAGSAAAAWAADAGHDVVLADAAVFPRDKACGDGLTPRAIAELDRLGLGDWVRGPGQQPRPARRRVRAAADPAVAGRLAARPRRRRAAHRAGRPHPDGGAGAGRAAGGGRPRGGRRAGRRPGHRRRVRHRRRAADRRVPPAGRRRRRAVAARAGARAASGTATPPTASPPAATSAPAAATTSGSPRTWSCAAPTTRCSPATAGCSRSHDGRGEHRRRDAGHRAPSGRRAAAQR